MLNEMSAVRKQIQAYGTNKAKSMVCLRTEVK